MNIDSEKDKYWIRTGVEVSHRDHPSRKMIVDNVVMRSVSSPSSDRRRRFIVGIDCHWITSSGDYGKGRFLTMELQPYSEIPVNKQDKEKVKKPSGAKTSAKKMSDDMLLST